MKYYYICDCCDQIFDQVEVEDPAVVAEGEELTGNLIKSTCPACREELYGGEESYFIGPGFLQ